MTSKLDIILKTEKKQTDECLYAMRHIKKILNGFRTFKEKQLQSGKADDHPEVIFINKMIQEFEKDLQTLSLNYPY